MLFILVKFVLQFYLISPEYELHRDEYLHIDQANHLAWGYLSVPPVTSWVSVIIKLLGNSEFWIKFFPALFGALTILTVWKTIKALNGSFYALILGATCTLLSVILRINILYQPNSLDILCWTAFYYFVIKYIKQQTPRYIYLAAVIFAIGFLNKYNILFALIGLLPAVVITRTRKILAHKEVYLAALLALIIISPNIIWQYNNHFPVIWHMKELSSSQLVNVNRIDFLINQLLFFSGGLFVIFGALYALLLYKPFKPYKPFFWAFFITLAVFIYLKAKDYYAIGLYPVYLAFGSVFLEKIFQKHKKGVLKVVCLVVPVLLFLPIYLIAFPNKSPEYIYQHQEKYKQYGLLRWEDGKDHTMPQDFADMQGWKELAQKVDNAMKNIPNPESTIVICDSYGQAGAINYYSKTGLTANAFEADYVNWFDLSKKYTNLVRVKERKDVDTEFEITSPYFEKSYISDSITNTFARDRGTTIFVFLNAKLNINKRLEKEISIKKRETE